MSDNSLSINSSSTPNAEILSKTSTRKMDKSEGKTANSEDTPDGTIKLKRKIGLLEGTAITIGAIVGSGIFISPKGIVASVGSIGLSLIIWVASGIVSLIGSVCYAELGTSLQGSGGDYHYLYEAFGPIPAFLFVWTSAAILIPCNIAILALSFAQYLIQPLFHDNTPLPDSSVKLLAAVAICFLVVVNCWDVGASAKIQNVFTFAKLLALLLIIVVGVIQIINGGGEQFKDPFENSNWHIGNITLAFFSGIYAYGGANTLNFMTEEVRNPTKTLPRAIFLSMFTVIIGYVLANMAYFSVLTPQEILDSDAVAVTFGVRTLGSGAWVISAFIVISTFGGLGVVILQMSRLLFVGARNGHMPHMLCYIQIQRLTPAPAVIFMGGISLLYLNTSSIYDLINYGGFVYNLAAVGIAGVILYLRKVRPELVRPIKVPLIYPILYLIISLCLFCLPIITAPVEAAVGCGIMLSGLPVYFLLIAPSKVTARLQAAVHRAMASVTKVVQKLLVSVPEEKGNDEDLLAPHNSEPEAAQF